MSYAVKEIFYTLQGEGANAGRAAVFCRFAGCNLWSGREEDRSKAICQFCDTDFVGTNGTLGGKYISADDLAMQIVAQWQGLSTVLAQKASQKTKKDSRLVVLTGGEPLLQIDDALIDALHQADFEIAVETNGTIQAPKGLDWICVSPKANADWILRSGNELKVVWPQENLSHDLETLEASDFSHYLLQPMDDANEKIRKKNLQACIDLCLQRPKWRLSLQTHKFIGIR